MTREESIIAIVSEHKKIEVNKLAELLSVSKVTIRKDLDKLESRGILHRNHGFAQRNSEADINYRLATNYEMKLKIARKAAESVQDGEMVLIESGSTCTLLAEEIARNRVDVTILTNSSFIANHIRKEENVKIILLGGEYQKESQVCVGPLVKKQLESFYVDKFFLGVDGFDVNRGFTGANMTRVETVRMMAKFAENAIVLTDSSKFAQKGVVTAFSFDEIAQVYTDSGIDEASRKFLAGHQIPLITVD